MLNKSKWKIRRLRNQVEDLVCRILDCIGNDAAAEYSRAVLTIAALSPVVALSEFNEDIGDVANT